MSDHPRDEFDDVPEDGTRQGTHRGHNPKAGAGSRAGFTAVVAAGVAALLIGAVAFVNAPRTAQDERYGPVPTEKITTSAPGSAATSPTDPGGPADPALPDAAGRAPEPGPGGTDGLPGAQYTEGARTDVDGGR